jgi:hypothetical protein
MDIMDFSQELLATTREAIENSKLYLDARKEFNSCLNQLQVLIFKAGLEKTKKSQENKIIELLSDNLWGEQAREINEKMLESEAQYKGLELVVKSYQAHASALQSILKMQINGENSQAIQQKYMR